MEIIFNDINYLSRLSGGTVVSRSTDVALIQKWSPIIDDIHSDMYHYS